LTLERFDDTLERTRFTLYFEGIVAGILLALAIYSGVIFASIRDRSYLWYAVYLFAIMISFVGLIWSAEAPLLTQFVFPRYPVVGIVLKRLSDPLAWIALVLFTRNFFRTFERFPAWDRALVAAAAAHKKIAACQTQPAKSNWGQKTSAANVAGHLHDFPLTNYFD
jgi:hypothetical protein